MAGAACAQSGMAGHGLRDPARTQRRTLDPAKLESILALDYPAELVEILIVSDGSTDTTENIVRRFTGRTKIEFLSAPQNEERPPP